MNYPNGKIPERIIPRSLQILLISKTQPEPTHFKQLLLGTHVPHAINCSAMATQQPAKNKKITFMAKIKLAEKQQRRRKIRYQGRPTTITSTDDVAFALRKM